MLKSIDLIRDFGIFKNFDWTKSQGIEDFNTKNIIYGWNYSGKTTLSKIFSALRDKSLPNDYKSAFFKLTCTSGPVDSTSLATFPYKVLVYNCDYSKENLRLEYDKEINAIFFEVGDNAKISGQISAILAKIDSINGTETVKGKKDAFQNAISEYQTFESLFTTEAGKIKYEAFSSLIEFNKGHLKKIKEKILPDLDKYIVKSKEEQLTLSKSVKIEEPKPKISNLEFRGSHSDLISKTNKLLQSVPMRSSVISILDKQLDAYDWAKAGLTLNNKNDNCILCGNILTETRFEELVQYFENEASKLREQISVLKDLINYEMALTSKLEDPLSVNDFNEGFQNNFAEKHNKLTIYVRKYRAVLSKMLIALRKKSNKSIYRKVNSPFTVEAGQLLQGEVDALNAFIDKNNQFTEDFGLIISKERDKYKEHLVAVFLKETKYTEKQIKYNKSITQIAKLDEIVQRLQIEATRLNALKESDSEGCAQFNAFVQSFLNRTDIEISLNPTTKKFNLMRGSSLASNLSEGEKMAISFSHFLVTLKSIQQKNILNEYIVFIDDPISSLDSNHIFQINSLLKEIFFELLPDPANLKHYHWQLKCKQLFISTHNFEFFTLLKELPKKNFKKDSKYFVVRNSNESTIERLPSVYNTFASEYHYLFGEILHFSQEPNKSTSSKLLLIPNILRRFLEMYTLTKYPSNEEVDARAEKVFGKRQSKRILKLLHHFSHFNSIDRIQKHSEFAADIEHASADLINLIKATDNMHFEALESAIIE